MDLVKLPSATGDALHVDEASGSDEPSAADGSSSKPFKTTLAALTATYPTEASAAQGMRPVVVRKAAPITEGETGSSSYEPISGAGLKKARKLLEAQWKKAKKLEETRESSAKLAAEQAERDAKRREEASKIVLEVTPEIEAAKKSKIGALASKRGQVVRVFGWVHRLRVQSQLTFITLRDGTGFLQLVLGGQLSKTSDALELVTECSIEVVGTLKEVPEGKKAPGGHELVADWWRLLGKAPSGEQAYASLFNDVSQYCGKVGAGKLTLALFARQSSDLSVRQNLRHLDLRGETPAAIMRVRASVLQSFRSTFEKMTVLEVTPPCIVQTSVEGGASLFKLPYYGKEAYLTQSSQLYLETCLPSLGDVFCVQESFRAENSHTRRHLSEYTHLEAELAYITFDDMLVHLEELICSVVDGVLADPIAGPLVRELNPDFKPPLRPFKRLDYKDAIAYLNEHHILFQDDDPSVAPREHRIGDDIAEAAERKMTDQMAVPIFLVNFPKHLKSFYMKKIKEDPEFTESVDVLMPGVGEIVGGSMRIADLDELMEGYAREGIPADPYYW